MIPLQRKLVIFLLLFVCAPLYPLLRYFYGKSFTNMLLLVLLLHLGVIPLLLYLVPAFDLPAPVIAVYNPDFSLMLGALALYVLPLHILWIFFHDAMRDTRYDLDYPGRFPLPVHPWLIDIPAAILLPLAIYRADQLPVIVSPEWLPFTMPTVAFSSDWFYPSIAMSVAYLAIALLSTRPIRLPRRRRLNTSPAKVRFDVATLGSMPPRSRERLPHIFARRTPDLRRLTGQF